MEKKRKKGRDEICGKCGFCSHTYRGCECTLTDRQVDYRQESCDDFIAEDDSILF